MEEGKNLVLSETAKKRVEWLDSLRGVSMILIIFSHTASYFSVMNYISEYIYAFYVPIFFSFLDMHQG